VVFVASEIPNLGDINQASKERKKRRHQKSRLGCIACKQRRVKARNPLRASVYDSD
jgi:hypothetical protein